MDNNYYSNREDTVLITDEALGIYGSPMPDPEKTREAKKISSRVHFSLFAYVFSANIFIIALSVIFLILSESSNSEWLIEFVEGNTFSLILNVIAQYVLAFPLFLFMIKALVKPKKYVRSTLKVKEYFLLLLVGEALMLIGSIIGNTISDVFGGIFDFTPENTIDTVVDTTPLWTIILVVCILAPIFEELIYRKLVMDRLGRLGGVTAIILSALAFALMHCNVYQFFYALAVGVIFGYVYEKTHNVLYTISMHMILNFIGTVVIIPIMSAADKLDAMNAVLEAGGTVDEVSLLLNQLLVMLYTSIQYAMLAGGAVVLILALVKKRREIFDTLGRPERGVIGASFLGVGTIVFIAFCTVMTLLNMLIV